MTDHYTLTHMSLRFCQKYFSNAVLLYLRYTNHTNMAFHQICNFQEKRLIKAKSYTRINVKIDSFASLTFRTECTKTQKIEPFCLVEFLAVSKK